MSEMQKCGRVRGWMANAISGLLSDSRRSEFEKHIGDCAACRAEFQRVENLLGRIDQSLRTELAVDPSPKLILSVRERIAAETQSEQWSAGWLKRNSWLSAAGVCAALAVLSFVLLAHRANRPVGNFAPHPQIANSAQAPVPIAPSRSASAENLAPRAATRARSSKPRLAVVRHELSRNPRGHRSEPEVIVQPGQMQAILQFVAETRSGRINGAEVENDIKAAEKPLEIKPLNIAPLETTQGDTNEDPAAKSRTSGSADGRSE